ncbi:MAG: SecY-interacting protein Syd [Lachnospiraceae bacterium]|nr:SecY-interacting protein Syd [Lachnospiraceae bacterium]
MYTYDIQAYGILSPLHIGSGGVYNIEKYYGIWGTDSDYANLLQIFLNKEIKIMNEVLKKYFEDYCDMWMKYKGTYPQVPYDSDIDSRLYIGTMDEEEYISWKPKVKDVITDFSKIEKEYNFKLNEEIKKYFNSFWFLELKGFIGEYCVVLEPVIPEMETDGFEAQLKGYFSSYRTLEYIPIGIETNTNSVIVIENKSGKVYFHDLDCDKKEIIADSFIEFVSRISFKRR